MRHHTTPYESLPREYSWLTKKKQTLSHLRASSSSRLILQYFRLSPGFPESCTIPKSSRIPVFAMLSRTCKPNAQSRTVYPKPKRVSEDKPMPESSAYLRTKTYARYRSPIPGSSTHIRSHKPARSRTLSEQRRYRESMASSTIFNITNPGFLIGSFVSPKNVIQSPASH